MCRGRCAWYDGVKKMRLRAQSTRQCFVCKICWGNEMIESTLAIRDKFFLSILFYFRSLKLWIVLSFHLFLYSCFFLHIFIHFSLFERLPFLCNEKPWSLKLPHANSNDRRNENALIRNELWRRRYQQSEWSKNMYIFFSVNRDGWVRDATLCLQLRTEKKGEKIMEKTL